MFWSHDNAQNDPTRVVMTASGHYTCKIHSSDCINYNYFLPYQLQRMSEHCY